MNTMVDEYFRNVKKFPKELKALREILTECGLSEELKWRNPCYTFKNNNIIILGEFKEYCALSFFKGVLLSDFENILNKPGENSQTVRIIRFKSLDEIIAVSPILKKYIFEAIEIETSGIKVERKESANLLFTDELKNILDKSPQFKIAFESLTPGRQRGYNIFFSEPKQSKTRVARIEKYTQRIIMGKGLNDCTCGLSKRMPNCDGSHNSLK